MSDENFREWAALHAGTAGVTTTKRDCQFCGRPTYRIAANGKPCCSACDDLPGREPL